MTQAQVVLSDLVNRIRIFVPLEQNLDWMTRPFRISFGLKLLKIWEHCFIFLRVLCFGTLHERKWCIPALERVESERNDWQLWPEWAHGTLITPTRNAIPFPIVDPHEALLIGIPHKSIVSRKKFREKVQQWRTKALFKIQYTRWAKDRVSSHLIDL